MKKFLVFIVLLAAAGAAVPAGAADLGRLNSLSYNYGSFHAEWRYELTRTDQGAVLEARGYNGVDLDVRKTLSPMALDRLARIMADHGVAAWNGFRGHDPDVMDGHGFTFRAVFDRGVIEASGYMKEPDNYQKGHRAIVDYLESLTASDGHGGRE